jgi:hypothetical protein
MIDLLCIFQFNDFFKLKIFWLVGPGSFQARNADKDLKNRCGVAQLPFQLLRPHSTPGVTAMGIPNSITA